LNRALIRRWLNEYLDGEIGLADKAELEHIMAAEPEVRREYMELRRAGLLLGSLPEVSVHPERFRRKVLAALDSRQRPYFTPQRAFAWAMLIVLLIVSLAFGLVLYQQKMLGNALVVTSASGDEINASNAQTYDLLLTAATTPEQFFNRLLVECQLGMSDHAVLTEFLLQTRIYEGAVCERRGGVSSLTFPTPLAKTMRVKVTPRQALVLQGLASELSAGRSSLSALARDGSQMKLQDFLQINDAGNKIILYINFS
jgi:hypothetical protein